MNISCGCHFIFLKYIRLIYTNIYELNFYNLSAWDGCWSLVSLWRFIYKLLSHVSPFDCTTVAGSGKAVPLDLKLTTPVCWLLSLQLTVVSQSVIVVKSNVLCRLCVSLPLQCLSFRGVCHTTASDPFLFLLDQRNSGNVHCIDIISRNMDEMMLKGHIAEWHDF